MILSSTLSTYYIHGLSWGGDNKYIYVSRLQHAFGVQFGNQQGRTPLLQIRPTKTPYNYKDTELAEGYHNIEREREIRGPRAMIELFLYYPVVFVSIHGRDQTKA